MSYTLSKTGAQIDNILDRADTGGAIDQSIALKAPLSSPSFTGTPTAPTPAEGDDSTQVATTAFVKSAAAAASYDLLVTDTASGDIASFPDGAEDIPVKSLIAQITPVQSGSGDPAPDNIRPISGWTGANIHVADGENPHVIDNVYPIDWTDEAGTVYGGTLDVTSGVLTVTHAKATYDGSNDENWSFGSGSRQYAIGKLPAPVNYTNTGDVVPAISNIAVPVNQTISYASITYAAIGGNTSARYDIRFIYAGVTDVGTISDFRTWLSNNPLEVCFELYTPTTIQLTPTEVATLLGSNNIFADCGAIEAEYRADTKLYIQKMLGA